MGGHDHHEVKVPDYRIYKVEDAPKLVKVQQALAAQGLRDPWLRNEVWRFREKDWGTEGQRIRKTVFRGFKPGLVACVLTIIGTTIYKKMYPDEHGHGHGGHGDHH